MYEDGGEITIRGKVYPLLFNVTALKEVGAKYGDIEGLSEKLKADYTEALAVTSWVIALLIQQGIELRNFDTGANDKGLTQAEVELLMKPREIINQQDVVIRAINDGMNILNGEGQSSDDEVDEVLEEILAAKNGEGAEDS